MNITQYLTKHELIGLEIEISDSKNRSLIGLRGKIIDETKNMLKIKTSKGTKKVVKNQVKMIIRFQDKKIELEGSGIIGRADDRIKNER